MQPQYPNLHLIKTVQNTDKKAGALNQGLHFLFEHFSDENIGFVFTMDADSILSRTTLANGVAHFSQGRPNLAGVCCRIGLLPLKQEPFHPQPFSGTKLSPTGLLWALSTVVFFLLSQLKFISHWFWWAFQNLEYCIAHGDIVERQGRAHCLAGPGTLFKTDALKKIAAQHRGSVWSADSGVEDFFLTKEIQALGYATFVGYDMFAYTDCPLGLLPHKHQRFRWYTGNFRTFFFWGLNRHTLGECTDAVLQIVWFFCRICLVIKVVSILQTGFIYIDSTSAILLWGLPMVTVLLNLPKFTYVSYKSFYQFLLFCFLYELYAMWYGLIIVSAVFLANRKLKHW